MIAAKVFTLTNFANPNERIGPSPNVGNQLGIRPIVRPAATLCGPDFKRNKRIR